MKKNKITKYIALSGIYTTKKPRHGYLRNARLGEKILQSACDRNHFLVFSNNRRKYYGKMTKRWRTCLKQEVKERRVHETNSIF